MTNKIKGAVIAAAAIVALALGGAAIAGAAGGGDDDKSETPIAGQALDRAIGRGARPHRRRQGDCAPRPATRKAPTRSR